MNHDDFENAYVQEMAIHGADILAIPITVSDLHSVVAAVQLALRHPRFPESIRGVLLRFVNGSIAISDRINPLLADALRKGNDRSHDVPLSTAPPNYAALYPLTSPSSRRSPPSCFASDSSRRPGEAYSNPRLSDVIELGTNSAGYTFCVARMVARWVGFARAAEMLFLLPGVSEGVDMGMLDVTEALRRVAAIAQDPESSFGVIERWHMRVEVNPEDYRCATCGEICCGDDHDDYEPPDGP